MKKSMLVLLTLVPVAVGLVVNFTLFVPVVGSLLFFLLPLATTIFWFILEASMHVPDGMRLAQFSSGMRWESCRLRCMCGSVSF